MAERRMFSKQVIDTDFFMDMPIPARLLYYDLAMRADDDGFVASPKKIIRMIGCSEDDLKILIAKQLIIRFDSGVCVIRDWKIHNYVRPDRYRETQYIVEKRQLMLSENGSYQIEEYTGMTSGIPTDNHMTYQQDTQVRLGEVSIGQDIPPIVPLGDSMTDIQTSGEHLTVKKARGSGVKPVDQATTRFDEFWATYPRKIGKGAARKVWARIKPNNELHTKIIAAVIEAKRSDQWQRNNGQYIPNPATWLNQGRWEDELTSKETLENAINWTSSSSGERDYGKGFHTANEE